MNIRNFFKSKIRIKIDAMIISINHQIAFLESEKFANIKNPEKYARAWADQKELIKIDEILKSIIS